MMSSMKQTWVTGSLFFVRTFCRCCTWKPRSHWWVSQITAERPLLVQKRLTCLQAAQIWSISFSRLVQRAARNAAVLPGVGSTALPGAPVVLFKTRLAGHLEHRQTAISVYWQGKFSNTSVIKLHLCQEEKIQKESKNFVRYNNTFLTFPLSGCYLWGWQAESVPWCPELCWCCPGWCSCNPPPRRWWFLSGFPGCRRPAGLCPPEWDSVTGRETGLRSSERRLE